MYSLRLLILAAVAVALPALADEAATGSIAFANGDRLSGRALGLTDEGFLLWESPNLHNDRLPLDIAQILDISVAGSHLPAPDATHVATVTLTNGDTLLGALKALDKDKVVLDTPIAGEVTLSRSMTSYLSVSKAERIIFSGPLQVDDWTISDGTDTAWRSEDGELVSQSSGAGIARSFDHGDRVRIEFDLNWRSTLRMSVLLASNDGETTQPDHCYELSINRRNVFLKMRPRQRIIGAPAPIPEFVEQEQARLEFYLDKKEGTIAFYVDGRQIHVWTDDRPDSEELGNWLHFVTTNNYPVRIANLRITEWTSAELPDDKVNEESPVLEGEEGQRIRLQNGDVIIGQIGEIEDGRLHIITPVTPVRIPLGRIRSMKLTGRDDPTYEEPRRNKGDVRAWFHNGSQLTFRLDSFEDNTLEGFSQTFGTNTFALQSLTRLEFNIYSERLRAIRAARSSR